MPDEESPALVLLAGSPPSFASSAPHLARGSGVMASLAGPLADELGLDGPARRSLLVAVRLHERWHRDYPRRGRPGSWPVLLRPDGSRPRRDASLSVLRWHHERVGAGGRSRGSRVPLGARILGVLDTFEQLLAHLPAPGGGEQARIAVRAAMSVLAEGVGTRYDARVVNALRAVIARPGLRSR